MKVDGVTYRSPAAIIIDVKDDYPVFVKIEDVFVIEDKPVAYGLQYDTVSFCRHSHAYIVSCSSTRHVVDLLHLFHHTPYFIRYIKRKFMVVPKYHICGTLYV